MSRKPRNQVAGHYTLVIQPKSRARWRDPQTPEFEPNWIARFGLPKATREEERKTRPETTMVPICEDCLSDRARNRELNVKCGASKDITKVTCRAAATLWADARLQALTSLAFQGRLQAELDRAKNPTRPAVRVVMETALQLFLANSDLRDKQKVVTNLQRLCLQWHGKPSTAVHVDEFDEDGLHRWVRMSQTVGNMFRKVARQRVSEEDWAKVRAMATLPPIDERRPAKHNKTIKTMIANLSQVFGENRKRYLREIQGHLPPLESMKWMISHGLTLPTVDNRIEFTKDHLDALDKHLPELKTENPHAWLMIQLSFVSGWRSGAEVMAIKPHWFIKYEKDATSPDGQFIAAGTLCMERRQRPEEGYELKTDNQTVSHVPIPAEVAALMETLPADQPLFGPNVEATYRRCNQWLVEKGCVDPEWNDRLYALRKLNATSRARLSGTAKAAEALNHDKDSKVTTKNYIAPSVVVYEPLTMDMARAGLQSKDYKPWR
jgi:hypothetical protein